MTPNYYSRILDEIRNGKRKISMLYTKQTSVGLSAEELKEKEGFKQELKKLKIAQDE